MVPPLPLLPPLKRTPTPLPPRGGIHTRESWNFVVLSPERWSARYICSPAVLPCCCTLIAHQKRNVYSHVGARLRSNISLPRIDTGALASVLRFETFSRGSWQFVMLLMKCLFFAKLTWQNIAVLMQCEICARSLATATARSQLPRER